MKKQLKEGNSWSGVFTNRKKSGDIWHSSITITPIYSDHDLFFVGVFRELEQLEKGIYISEKKRIETQRELLKVLAISCEIRDPSIEEHLLKVQELTEILVNAHEERNNLNLSTNYINDIIHASIMHDIGKAEIPEGILYKPGPLTLYERKIIEMHPLMGADILNKISKELNQDVINSLEVIKNIILYHHEKWDGTGYPHKLKGEEIPFEARIVAIVDVFDALTSRRPYKDSWAIEKSLSFINEQKGKHFDPTIAETFIDCFDVEKHSYKKKSFYSITNED
ncbi:HD domain-containing phosphohydrolase [Bacillus sp. FJAT-29937]|uniref:HD domain-containing phosphohydrolase n=1 Tax=Bacillus sp. FJAT-29937 TaxID=1720553 RepID=UPI00082C4C88|nr:HD domain-containing phosphohydrolase [Bacillus sp. FJAT-29937]